eukprot:gnl/MRDRNA2_/MRDRNA2_86247_c1_seq1.p1 gnl/MRDRNA2_/MRDRNA2_86247_c1~~gnl/MRDRNA2_/MRDRNA2_86247_c1_seq1.p1  ORF type:complete len:195 (-),score=46.92 gnl/MRDRNA2_/MRDRNA2_86247_c1_seq1:53-637(-)
MLLDVSSHWDVQAHHVSEACHLLVLHPRTQYKTHVLSETAFNGPVRTHRSAFGTDDPDDKKAKAGGDNGNGEEEEESDDPGDWKPGPEVGISAEDEPAGNCGDAVVVGKVDPATWRLTATVTPSGPDYVNTSPPSPSPLPASQASEPAGIAPPGSSGGLPAGAMMNVTEVSNMPPLIAVPPVVFDAAKGYAAFL